jgi:hypothetical protein
MKVRVTYNWVSNTKYSTIYVKNPLKADVSWYELTNGDIYLMNTSEALYTHYPLPRDTSRRRDW